MKLEVLHEMIEKYQCPGCGVGHKIESCSRADVDTERGCCKGHVTGTSFLAPNMLGRLILGMPKGFDKNPLILSDDGEFTTVGKPIISLTDVMPEWDHLNIPVWAREHEGDLFVKSISPRIGLFQIHVILGGKFADLPPGVHDVNSFISTID